MVPLNIWNHMVEVVKEDEVSDEYFRRPNNCVPFTEDGIWILVSLKRKWYYSMIMFRAILKHRGNSSLSLNKMCIALWSFSNIYLPMPLQLEVEVSDQPSQLIPRPSPESEWQWQGESSWPPALEQTLGILCDQCRSGRVWRGSAVSRLQFTME